MALRRAFSAPVDICAIHCCWMSQVSLACHRFQRLGFRSYTTPRKLSLRRCVSMSPSQQPLKYILTEKTLLSLKQGDLTRYEGDAIVNAANDRLLGGGGVDGAIHRAAGRQLLEACKALPIVHSPSVRCPTGEAKITEGFGLPARRVIHTVGPIYNQYSKQEAASHLANAHKNSLALANEHGLKTVAFPAISCGVYGYPAHEAAMVALGACREAAGNVEEIAFILFSQDTFDTWKEAAEGLKLQPV